MMADQLHGLKGGRMPGVPGTLTFAEIHFKTIKTLRLDLYRIPSFDPTEQFFGGDISRMLVFWCRGSQLGS
jgi:hypothetical protein